MEDRKVSDLFNIWLYITNEAGIYGQLLFLCIKYKLRIVIVDSTQIIISGTETYILPRNNHNQI